MVGMTSLISDGTSPSSACKCTVASIMVGEVSIANDAKTESVVAYSQLPFSKTIQYFAGTVTALVSRVFIILFLTAVPDLFHRCIHNVS